MFKDFYMTPKEFVKSKIPKARAERHTDGSIVGATTTYWLIRNGNENMWFAEGKSEAKAWASAKDRIIEQDRMRISNLINVLTAIQEAEGDLLVCTSSGDEYWGTLYNYLNEYDLTITEHAKPDGPKSNKSIKALVINS